MTVEPTAIPRVIEARCRLDSCAPMEIIALPAEVEALSPSYLRQPSYEQVKEDKLAFIDMFHTFYQNCDPVTAKGLHAGGTDSCALSVCAVHQTIAVIIKTVRAEIMYAVRISVILSLV